MHISPLYVPYLNMQHVAIWDPHQEYLIYEIEKIQRQAARWTLSDYNRYSSMIEMLNLLGWSTLESRRYNSRLYKIMHHHILPYIYRHTICHHNIQPDTSNRTTLYYQLYPLLPISKAFFQRLSINGTIYQITITSQSLAL